MAPFTYSVHLLEKSQHFGRKLLTQRTFTCGNQTGRIVNFAGTVATRKWTSTPFGGIVGTPNLRFESPHLLAHIPIAALGASVVKFADCAPIVTGWIGQLMGRGCLFSLEIQERLRSE